MDQIIDWPSKWMILLYVQQPLFLTKSFFCVLIIWVHIVTVDFIKCWSISCISGRWSRPLISAVGQWKNWIGELVLQQWKPWQLQHLVQVGWVGLVNPYDVSEVETWIHSDSQSLYLWRIDIICFLNSSKPYSILVAVALVWKSIEPTQPIKTTGLKNGQVMNRPSRLQQIFWKGLEPPGCCLDGTSVVIMWLSLSEKLWHGKPR